MPIIFNTPCFASPGGASASQASIGDLFLLRIDSKNNPVALDKIEKGIDKVPLVADGISIGMVTRILTIDGSFGYLYTDENGESNKKTIVTNGEFDDDSYGTAATTFDEKKGFKEKKFNIEKEKKDRVYIRRGKPGHLLIMKYSAKEKKITLNLERVS